jgi:hypothetical protein
MTSRRRPQPGTRSCVSTSYGHPRLNKVSCVDLLRTRGGDGPPGGSWSQVSPRSRQQRRLEGVGAGACRLGPAAIPVVRPCRSGTWMSAHSRSGRGHHSTPDSEFGHKLPARMWLSADPQTRGREVRCQPDETSALRGRTGSSLALNPFRHQRHSSEVLTGPKWYLRGRASLGISGGKPLVTTGVTYTDGLWMRPSV